MSRLISILAEFILGTHSSSATSTLVKSEAGINYVRLVKNIKAAFIALFTMWLLTGSGVLAVFIGTYSVLSYNHVATDTVYLVMILVSGVTLLISVGAMWILLSESFWMKVSKVDELVASVTKDAPPAEQQVT